MRNYHSLKRYVNKLGELHLPELDPTLLIELQPDGRFYLSGENPQYFKNESELMKYLDSLGTNTTIIIDDIPKED